MLQNEEASKLFESICLEQETHQTNSSSSTDTDGQWVGEETDCMIIDNEGGSMSTGGDDQYTDIPPPTKDHVDKLKESFGHSNFKPEQWRIIHSILKDRRDTCAVMATVLINEEFTQITTTIPVIMAAIPPPITAPAAAPIIFPVTGTTVPAAPPIAPPTIAPIAVVPLTAPAFINNIRYFAINLRKLPASSLLRLMHLFHSSFNQSSVVGSCLSSSSPAIQNGISSMVSFSNVGLRNP
uniref:Uncharacterized protein n=1 Tax=Amphimedon queenslandica TaxID=400682 RepID=A0A1X7SIE9_AMPQE